jgi:cytochrome c556
VLAAALLLPSGPAFASDSPAASVAYRQDVMKSLASHMRALRAIADGQVSHLDHALIHAEAVAATAHVLPSLFPPGTGPDKASTGARPTIWSDPKVFRAAASALEVEAERVVAAARAGDRSALRTSVAATSRACSTCHDRHRLKDY